MKKVSKIIVLSLVILGLSTTSTSASSGKLKSASIVECGGQTYGSHSGDNHWHVAVKHDAGWYPSGGNLGTSNPCSGGSSYESQPSSAPVYIAPSAQEVEAERKELERIAEEKRIQEELELAEKLKAEEELRVETERLNDTTLTALRFSNTTFDEKQTSASFIPQGGYKDFVVETKNEGAKYEISLEKESAPFTYNKVIVDVTSENTEKKQMYTYPVYEVGTQEEFLKQKLQFNYIIKGQNHSVIYNRNPLDLGVLSKEEIDSIVFKGVTVNGHDIIFDHAVPLADKNDKLSSATHSISFKLQNHAYYMNISVTKKQSSTEPIFFGTAAIVIAFVGYRHLKKKSNPKKTKSA